MKGIVTEFNTRVEPRDASPGEDEDLLRLDVGYDVVVNETAHDLSDWRGVVLRNVGGACCRHCRAPIAGGRGRDYCYDCFSTLARCDLCVMSPDRCHYHEGSCREPKWGESFCMQPHTVYLALSHAPKVGITRAGREWYRWADQGAHRAIKLVSTPSRRMAGVIEAHLGQWITDRTDWRKLVTGQKREFNLLDLARDMRGKAKALNQFASAQINGKDVEETFWFESDLVCELFYPVGGYAPAEQIRLDSYAAECSDKLLGVIGGYLLLSKGVIAMSSLTRGDIEIERKDDVEVEEKPQLALF